MKIALQPMALGLALFTAVPTTLMAFEWGSANVQYLKGRDYVNPFVPKDSPDRKFDQDIMTVEHANGWKYGDNFLFVDVSGPSQTGAENSVYFEFDPRISSKKTLAVNYSGLVADVLLSTQYNAASGFPVYLYGAAVDLNLPGFNFFQSNFFVRDDRNRKGTSLQASLVWNLTFKAGIDWDFSGVLDYATKEGDDTSGKSEANLLTQPALVAKLTPELGVGLEYQYWSNKLGVKGANESVPQLLVKAQF